MVKKIDKYMDLAYEGLETIAVVVIPFLLLIALVFISPLIFLGWLTQKVKSHA